MAPMNPKVNDGKDEDGGRPEPQDRRSQQRAGDRQRSALGRHDQLPVGPEGLEKR